jgi:hypothetical protein
MFPIGSIQPVDTATFRAGVARGLAPLGVGPESVSTEGDFPRFDKVALDLTGARFHRGLQASPAAGDRAPLCFAREFSVTGKPVTVESVPV